MKSLSRMVLLVLASALVPVAAASCRDIDEPPPLPVYDPDAPLDGGDGDASPDGALT